MSTKLTLVSQQFLYPRRGMEPATLRATKPWTASNRSTYKRLLGNSQTVRQEKTPHNFSVSGELLVERYTASACYTVRVLRRVFCGSHNAHTRLKETQSKYLQTLSKRRKLTS